jgi:hypothetical protein
MAGVKSGLLLHSLRTLQFGTKEEYVLKNIDLLLVTVNDIEKNEELETFLVAQLVYILKNNELSPANVNKIIQTVKNKNNMSAYDYLIGEATKQGIEKGIEKGASLKEEQKNRDFATSLIFSTDFDDEKIAMLVGVSTEYVAELRIELVK